MATHGVTPAAGVPLVERGVFVRTIQGGVIKSLFDALKDLVHDVTLRVDAGGIKMLAFDKSKCALVHLKLRADAFENYVCEPADKHYDLCVDVGNMFKLLKSAGNKDVISLAYDATGTGATNVLEIGIHNPERQSNTTYQLKLLDLDSDVRELNKAEVRSTISMPSTYFQRLCRDMSEISAAVWIQSAGGTVTFACDGDFASQCTTIGNAGGAVEPDSLEETDDATDANETNANANQIEATECEGKYALKYLVSFCKATNLCPTVKIHLCENFMIVSYKVASLGNLKFCLCGMIE